MFLLQGIYITFLAGCFRSIRFGLEESHGRGQALQFNYLLEKNAFCYDPDTGLFHVNEDEEFVASTVEALSGEILTIQAKGDKDAAAKMLAKYAIIEAESPLEIALAKLKSVPVDIKPIFSMTSV